MKLEFSGTIQYANGKPVQDVTVRIFDRDAVGKQDDDLTVNPGVSDEKGRFRLTYEPLRYLDYHTLSSPGTPEEPFATAPTDLRLPDLGDIYLPYLQFNYTFNGAPRQHRQPLKIFQKTFHLPESPPLDFLPSTHGFKFTNAFSGYFLPFSTPAFMGAGKVSSQYGLCGGMCAGAYDFALAGREIPKQGKVPRQGTRLQRYLFRRQMDSLGGIGQEVVKVAQWTCLPDDTLAGAQARTGQGFAATRQKLEDKNLVVLALIYDRAKDLFELPRVIFNNHQVLAYACSEDGEGGYRLQVYDPNLPGRDDVLIECQPVIVGEVSSPSGPQPVMGLKSTQRVGGEFFRNVRGFFSMPYSPVKPPSGL
ncbi:MAG: hypothetical protein ACM3H7_01300 [Acidobacteriaceae bacterium]